MQRSASLKPRTYDAHFIVVDKKTKHHEHCEPVTWPSMKVEWTESADNCVIGNNSRD